MRPQLPAEALVEQVAALQRELARERRVVELMRASHFWRLRDAAIAWRARLGRGGDPLPVPTAAQRADREAAAGDAYQLRRLRERLAPETAQLVRELARAVRLDLSLVVTVDARGASTDDLAASVASLRAQAFGDWRGVILGGVAAGEDERIEVVAHPPRFDRADVLAWLVAGDVLEPDALLSVALRFAAGADLVYTDEDRLDDDGVCRAPDDKPDWSPETLLTRPYVGRACFARASLALAGGWSEASVDPLDWYELLLRADECSARVEHVPRIVYHRRTALGIGADAGAAAAGRALARRGERAEVVAEDDGWDVRFIARSEERVAIVLPTRDRSELLEGCLSSLFARTQGVTFEVIVVDNGSREAATHALFERWREREPHRFRVVADPAPFNFSRLVNAGIAATDAPAVVLLNNDTAVIAPGWLERMLGQARRAAVGAVGALLLYPDDTVQHAGVLVGGVDGLAGHAFRGYDVRRTPLPAALRFDTNYLAVTGACLLVERHKYEEVGPFDEALAVEFNDVDFCLRLHAAGYRNVVVPKARLYHFESKSRGDNDTAAKRQRARGEAELMRQRWAQFIERDPLATPAALVRS